MEKSFSPVLMKRLFQITKTEAHYILSSADELKETYTSETTFAQKRNLTPLDNEFVCMGYPSAP